MMFNIMYQFNDKTNLIDNALFDTSWSLISSKLLRVHNINDVDDESVRGQTLSYGFNLVLMPSSYYYYKSFSTPYHVGYALLSLQKKYGLKTKVDSPLLQINYKKSVNESLVNDLLDHIFISGVESVSMKNILNYPAIKPNTVTTNGVPYFDINFGIVYNDTFSTPLDKTVKICDYVNMIRKDFKVTNESKMRFAYNISFLQTKLDNENEGNGIIKRYESIHTVTDVNGRDLMDKEIYELSFSYFATVAYEEGAMKYAQVCDKLLDTQKTILSKI